MDQADILRCEAEAILAGIVMDTKNFTIRTGERTFDAAAFLRRAGADTAQVKKLLQNDLEHTVARYKILQQTRLYRDSIAIAVSETPQDRVKLRPRLWTSSSIFLGWRSPYGDVLRKTAA